MTELNALNNYPDDEGDRKVIVFPNNPDDDELFSCGQYVWRYNGIHNKWFLIGDGERPIRFGGKKVETSTTNNFDFWSEEYWNSIYAVWTVGLIATAMIISMIIRSEIYEYNVDSEADEVMEVAQDLGLSGAEAVACMKLYTNDGSTIDYNIDFNEKSIGLINKCAEMADDWDDIENERYKEEQWQLRLEKADKEFNETVMPLDNERKIKLLNHIDIYDINDINKQLNDLTVYQKESLTELVIKQDHEAAKAEAKKGEGEG